MTDLIYFNDEWNIHLEKDEKDRLCPIHKTLINQDEECKKCLEKIYK